MNVKEIPFEELVEKYEPLIHSRIKKVYINGFVDEMYQISLIALWEAKTKYDETKGPFAGFADRYVSGKLLNYFNKELLFQQRYFASLEPEVVNNIPAEEETNQLSFPVERIKPYLTKSELTWFTEYLENNKGQTQIAEEYNVSVNTVKTWRRRAIEKIQQHLKMSELCELLEQ